MESSLDDIPLPTYFGEQATPSSTLAAKMKENERRAAIRQEKAKVCGLLTICTICAFLYWLTL